MALTEEQRAGFVAGLTGKTIKTVEWSPADAHGPGYWVAQIAGGGEFCFLTMAELAQPPAPAQAVAAPAGPRLQTPEEQGDEWASRDDVSTERLMGDPAGIIADAIRARNERIAAWLKTLVLAPEAGEDEAQRAYEDGWNTALEEVAAHLLATKAKETAPAQPVAPPTLAELQGAAVAALAACGLDLARFVPHATTLGLAAIKASVRAVAELEYGATPEQRAAVPAALEALGRLWAALP